MSRWWGEGDKAVHICMVCSLSLIRCMHAMCVFLLVKHHLRGNRYILVGVWGWEGELVCVTVDKFTPFLCHNNNYVNYT